MTQDTTPTEEKGKCCPECRDSFSMGSEYGSNALKHKMVLVCKRPGCSCHQPTPDTNTLLASLVEKEDQCITIIKEAMK